MRYLANGKEIFVPAGTVLCREGDAVEEDAVYYVMEGKVRLSRHMASGYTFQYSVQKDGLFGVPPPAGPAVRIFTATAETNCQLYVWPKQAYDTALSLYIEFAKLSIQELSRFLRAINKEAEKVWINYVR